MTADVLNADGHRAGRRHARWPRFAMAGIYAVLAGTALGVPAVRMPAVVGGVLLFGVLVLVYGVRAATRMSLQTSVRRGWWLLSGGFLLLNLIPAGFVFADPQIASVDSTTSMSSPPGPGDWIRLLAGLPMLAGLLAFPRSHATKRDIHKLLLDVVTVVGGSFMLLWSLVLGPTLSLHLPPFTMIAGAAFPIGDLALIFGAAVVVMRGAHSSVRRPMRILLGGLSLLVVSDTYLGYAKLHPGNDSLTELQLGILMSGLCLLALAGLEQCIVAGADDNSVHVYRPSNGGSKLPYAALAAGCILLVVQAIRSGLYPWGGLIVGAVVMTAAVAVRQFIAMRENHDLITRDSLTGLSNRVRLHEALGRAADRSNRTNERTAVMLIDMDGFKQINDTLGHDAGDQLLVGFARLLTASVLGSDTVARLGGDEFAIVLNNVGTTENAGAVATRIITGMQNPVAVNGEPVCPAASIGIAVSTPGQPMTAADLLHQADMAMYQAKERPGNCYQFSTESSLDPHIIAAS